MTINEDLTPPVPLTPHHLEAGMRAFFRIAALWELSEDEQLRMLGITSPSILESWKAAGIAGISAGTIERLGLIFGIFRAINMIMQQPERADAWMRRPNTGTPFAGLSAIERMAAGDISDLDAVRRYLDTVCGRLG